MDLARHPLTYLRKARNWSMSDLVRELHKQAKAMGFRCGATRTTVFRWEREGMVPRAEYTVLLAKVFDVPAHLPEQVEWPLWLPTFEDPAPFTPGGLAALREVRRHPMDRRAFLIFTGSSLSVMASQWSAVEPERLVRALTGDTVSDELLTWLERRASELRGMRSGSAVSGLVDGMLQTAVELVEKGRYDVDAGQRLYRVVADLAHQAAWARFDDGRHASAQRHWQAALHAAHQAKDHDVGAVTLGDLAYQQTWLNRPDEADDILTIARERAGSPAVRSLLDLRRARALAAMDDTPGTRDALLSAEAELDKASPATTPALIAWMSSADLAVDAGRCWLDLGRYGEARDAIGQGLSELDKQRPSRPRTRAIFLTHQAEVELAHHDLPAAASYATQALDTALETQASRCVDLVVGMIGKLKDRNEAEIVELHDYARSRLATV